MDETIDYDVFTYHALSSRTELGMGAKLSLDGETWEVAKVTPPVHEGRRAALYCKLAPARAPSPADWDPSRRSASADEG